MALYGTVAPFWVPEMAIDGIREILIYRVKIRAQHTSTADLWGKLKH
jgi:hypothetical protein